MMRNKTVLTALIATWALALPAMAQDDPPAEETPAEGEAGEPAAPAAPEEKTEGEAKPEEQQPPPATPPPAAPAEQPAPAAAPPATAPAASQPNSGGVSFGFGTNTNPQADTGAQGGGPGDGAAKEEKLPWRGTDFAWDNSATTETVGIGRDPQSDNPTYEMSFIFQPRYYLWEDGDLQSISLRGRVDLVREFTNSDSTTDRGEWSLNDIAVFPQYSRNLYKDGDVRTDLGIRVPTLQFPTSVVSQNNGRILNVGAMVMGTQQVPLMGSESDVLQTFALTLRAGYNHWFTEATQPTNGDLGYVRLGPDGRSLPGDQLGGAAHAQHQASFDIIGDLAITDRVSWTNWFSWRPAWKYEFENKQVCAGGLTGTSCTTPQTVDDPNNFAVVTLFNTEVSVDIIDELSAAVGYANLTLQVGPEGQRRNVFYSPDARVYATISAHIDEIYKTATGKRASTETAQTPKAPTVAKAKSKKGTN